MTLTIKASWIKETREDRNDNWVYDYKQLLLNDNPAHIYCLRIPVNAPGIKAIEYNAEGGITNEYEQVYIDNDNSAKCLHHCTTTLFDIRYANADKLAEERDTLTIQYKNASQSAVTWEDIANERGGEITNLKTTIQEQSAEVLILKAKLYDLMTDGA